MQSSVLDPACEAGAHVGVGIAGQHLQSRALAASKEASSPARYRALRIRFDPPSRRPLSGGSCVVSLSSIRREASLCGAAAAPHLRGGERRRWILTRSATPSIALLHRQIHRQKSVPVSNPQLPPDFERKQSAWQEGISSRFNEVGRCTSRQNSGPACGSTACCLSARLP